ncbi:hypothetical protein HanRHA438_Chr08g0348231 [Helianthus annuus]|nr:hypothetical protein HanHA300_Chr08g0278231 [Helianthus annuus]KAJ0546698.1 hypothetical protein HanIR_Chr08g0363821 [Helianthus annuus]KAJ0553362.1 hypothetical protein HanHA89_Chr08g0295541 [Helianthus annuus]KAJ0719023.1 hypothetical protein HanLR1_Chr08g0277121 [Helianthus annuus]KAJ0897671.1 hypothetical protein HanRHA438_Chr08g0348231 [Helianthus annuus]
MVSRTRHVLVVMLPVKKFQERNLNAKWSLHNKLGQVSLRTTMMVLILHQ